MASYAEFRDGWEGFDIASNKPRDLGVINVRGFPKPHIDALRSAPPARA
jgi:hypothetical protein